jgi:peptidoglycan DL-endopeptidase LytE
MKHRWTFMWMGLLVLFLIIGIQTQAFSTQQYRVKQGDTLGKISKKFGVSIEALKQANHLQGNSLHLKQALIIPSSHSNSIKKNKVASAKDKKKAASYYTVRKGDTLAKIAKKQGSSVADLKAMNHLQGTALKVGRRLMVPRGAIFNTAESSEQSAMEKNADLRPLEEDLVPLTDQEWEEIEKEQGENREFLGKWRNIKERQLLVKVTLGFIGAPYRSGGDTVRGLDSSGFVQKIYEIFDVNLPRTALEQSRLGKRVDRTDLQEGDLVFFHDRRATAVVGIYIGSNKFVHASPDGNREVRVGNLNEPNYENHFIKAVRLKDLDGGA